MVTVDWNEDAVADFDNIYTDLMRLDIIYAESFSDAILTKVDQIKKFPKSGKMFLPINNPRIRETITKNYRIIYYLKTSDSIEILSIIHTSQNIKI